MSAMMVTPWFRRFKAPQTHAQHAIAVAGFNLAGVNVIGQ